MPDPTPDQIKQLCLKIQEEWTPEIRYLRETGKRILTPLTVPTATCNCRIEREIETE